VKPVARAALVAALTVAVDQGVKALVRGTIFGHRVADNGTITVYLVESNNDFFFPNDPALYAGTGPIVKCDEEDGLKRVDTYNTFSLDYITQQGILREGYLDLSVSNQVSVRGGRFIAEGLLLRFAGHLLRRRLPADTSA